MRKKTPYCDADLNRRFQRVCFSNSSGIADYRTTAVEWIQIQRNGVFKSTAGRGDGSLQCTKTYDKIEWFGKKPKKF